MRPTITMHPLLLYFSESDVERMYANWRSESTFISMDYKSAVLCIAFFVCFGIKKLYTGASQLSMLLIAALLVGWMLQVLTIRLADDWWLRHRLILVPLLRSLRVGIFIVAFPLWVPHRDSSALDLFRSLSLGSGSTHHIGYAFGAPMLFRYHLLIQIPSAAVMMAMTGWKRCHEFVQTKASARKISRICRSVSH